MKRAEDILKYFGIESPEEIDLETICYFFNAEIQIKPLTGCEGRLIGYKGRAIITVNSNSSKNRQKFSIGHELGHWLLDRGSVAHACTKSSLEQKWNGTSIESRANRFSADLLMPEKWIRSGSVGKKFRVRDISVIADSFGVSKTAVAFRLLELDIFNGLLIWSDGEKRTSNFVSNPSLPKKAWPVDLIDKESCAAYLKNKDVGESRGLPVPGDLWINRVDASHSEVYEDSIVVSEKVILTLISWPSEKYLLSLMES